MLTNASEAECHSIKKPNLQGEQSEGQKSLGLEFSFAPVRGRVASYFMQELTLTANKCTDVNG